MKVARGDIKQSESVRRTLVISAPHGVLFDEFKKPEVWAHVTAELSPLDRIEIYAEDMSYYGELIVVEVERLWAKTKEIRYVLLDEIPDEDIAETHDHKVLHKGAAKKWCVIREKDKAIVKEGFISQSDALAWMNGHEKAMAA